MKNDLQQTWNDIAKHLDDWGPPLRRSAEDTRITIDALKKWHVTNPVPKAGVFLCGVTPEIATMAWPFPIELVAMDQAESMVRFVWPGDVPGVRRAVVGNWLHSGLPAQSQEIVIGDGGFGFASYPDGQRTLARELSRLLKPGGLFIYRHYASPEKRETLEQVRAALHANQIGNFHIFKWRVAMAIEHNSRKGARQHDIWQACMDSQIDPTKLPQPGFSDRAISTIRFYRDKDARLYFPTLAEFRSILNETLTDTEVVIPSYELGERCPFVIARGK